MLAGRMQEAGRVALPESLQKYMVYINSTKRRAKE